jgi:hypothetical protein
MLDLLGDVLHGILDIPYLVIALLVESINGWIMIIALIVSAALAILPGFPSIPTLDGKVLSGVAWFLPITPMLAVFSTFVAAFIVWLGVSSALRWGKML